jgi:hypothetical protein
MCDRSRRLYLLWIPDKPNWSADCWYRFISTKRVVKEIGVRPKQTANKMFLQWCLEELVYSFAVVQRLVFVILEAAWERQHCRNTNVGAVLMFLEHADF